MLIEYTEATKEENLAPTAIEIRKRIAGRRLQKSLEDGILNQDGVFSITEANRKEHKEHVHVNFGVSMAGVANRVTVARAEQQLNIENKLKLLDRDVARASSLSKSKVDTLTDLERRILDMKSQLRQHHVSSVNEEISKVLRTDDTVLITKNFSECPKCKRKILSNLLATHEKQCQLNPISLTKEILLIEDKTEKQAAIFETATFTPGVPRNCRLVSKGCNFIEWAYDPPVTDGGLLVTDYEIKYEGKFQEMDPKINKWRKETFEVPSVATSRWIMQKPINENGFKLVDLRSETEYFNFYIRCKNLRGCSDWVPMNDGSFVRTMDTEPPSIPLFFECARVTSSCLHLRWSPPWFNGGQEIVDYVIHYTVIEREISVTSREVMVEKSKILNLGSSDCSTVVRNIMSDSEVVKISIQSKNKRGLLSEKCKLGKNLRTEKSSRHMELQRQLHLASKITEDFIDTDFFAGIQQRVPLKDFIADVKRFLLQTEPTEEEAEEAFMWGQIIEKIEEDRRIQRELDEMAEKLKSGELTEDIKDEDDTSEDSEDEDVIAKKKDKALKKSFLFTNAQRRRHYEKKIRKVEMLMESLTNERHELDMNRARLANHMQTTQARQMLLKVERDRLSNYNSEYVTSSVIHGYETQYLLEDFLDNVAEEYAKCQTEISTTKLRVMNGEKRKAEIKLKLEKLEYLLKERKAAFLQFETHCKSTFKSLARLQGLSGVAEANLKPHYFLMWRQYVDDRGNVRRKVTRTFQGLLTRYKASAFMKWKSGEFEMDSSDSSRFLGVGSKLLQEAKEQRVQLQGILRETIAGMNNIRQAINVASLTKENRKALMASTAYKMQEEGMDHIKLAEGNLRFLYEADGYVAQGKYDLAYRLYEAQIIFLRSLTPVNVKQLAICHGRQGRMFAMMGKFDRSILEFDRQLSLAREIEDKSEEANAYFGIGFGYLKRFSYEDSIRYLDIAQGMFGSLGLSMKRVAALTALKDCFDRTGKLDNVKMYQDRIDLIEGGTRSKISLIDKKLKFMQERLVHTAADIELIIKIERTTLKSLQLRNKISEMTAKQKDYDEQRKVYEEVMNHVMKILDAIQVELKEAFETDELEMWSKLVQDTPQLVDVEELKTRLAARKVAELANFDREKNEHDRLAKLISNLEDDLEEADDTLKLEEGALMTRARHDKPFRCISFCAANAAGNEVTGTATGGVEQFLAAEGNNVHVIDHHNGSLVTVLVGDSKSRVGEKTGHVGIVTCLVHDGSLIFSGSIDETIISWDGNKFNKVRMFRGHEGSIVSLTVDGPYLASGSADTTIRLWDKVEGTQLRVVFGHSKSITSLEMGPTWLLSGSTDEEVRVWEISKKHKHTLAVDCKCRLIGHETGITCVRFGRLEVISGDVEGRIFLWWTETGAILRKMNVHKGSVKCMQFDAIHIVSGGVDNCVCITDIATGDVLQSLRGHEGHILAISFDTERILSASGDNTMRFWSWGKKSLPEDKIHILNQGETLVAVAKMYDISANDLALWNGITDVRKQMYPGMNLIVRKGDPSAPTAAERAAAERARRIEQAKGLTAKKFQAEGAIGAALKYDRINRLATDFDLHSMGNRMFATEKHENELFPDAWDPNQDRRSLGARLARLDVHEEELREEQPKVVVVAGNEDVWGPMSDSLATTMLNTFVELEAYEIVLMLMSLTRDNKAVVGRVHRYEMENASRFAEESESEELKQKLLQRHAEFAERKAKREELLLGIEQREAEEQQDQGQDHLHDEPNDGLPHGAHGAQGVLISLLNDVRNFEAAAMGRAVIDNSVVGKDINNMLQQSKDAAIAEAQAVAIAEEEAAELLQQGAEKKKKHKRTLSAEKRAAKNRIRKWHYVAPNAGATTEGANAEAELDQLAPILDEDVHLSDSDALVDSFDSVGIEQQAIIDAADRVAAGVDAYTQQAAGREEQPEDDRPSSTPSRRHRNKKKRSLSAERRAAKNQARKLHSQQIALRLSAQAAAPPPPQPSGIDVSSSDANSDVASAVSSPARGDHESLSLPHIYENKQVSKPIVNKEDNVVRFPPI